MTAQPRMTAAACRAGPGRLREDAVHVPILAGVRANVSAFAYHVPNEAKRSMREAQRQKARGMMPGFGDVAGLADIDGRFFMIEVKRPGATWSDVSDPQRVVARMVQDRGGLWTWCTSLEAAQDWCRQVGIVRPRDWRAPWAVEHEEYSL